MSAVFLYLVGGRPIVAGLMVVLLAQEYPRSPNDIGGVGAQGTIGRGVSPGERPAAWGPSTSGYAPVMVGTPTPIPPRYIYVYVTPAAPAAATAAAPVAATPAEQPPPARAARPSLREPALVRNNPYVTLHRRWLHGYWNAHESQSPAWRLSAVTRVDAEGTVRAGAPATAGGGGGLVPIPVREPGMGLGWGLPAWLIGPMAYRWGYFPYTNPYIAVRTTAARETGILDYSRAVNVVAPPPTDVVLHEAMQRFFGACEAFRREDYVRALALADESLSMMPNDPTIHQFRAQALLALRRYRDAAAASHAVIAVVPGWDWTTLTGLYDNPETYTRQLRALEAYAFENPGSAEAQFLLALQYLTMGYPESAADQLQRVVDLQPFDTLARQLLRELRPADSGGVRPSPPRRGAAGKLEGSWAARPRSDTTILMALKPRGQVDWTLRREGQEAPYRGFYVHDQGILTLMQDQDNTMVGALNWTDPRHFTFKALEDRPDEPGLVFEASP